jgi:hypothetical protein
MWTQADTEERRYGDTGEDGHLMVKIVLWMMCPQAKESLGLPRAEREKTEFPEGFGRMMALLAPWFQTFSLQYCEKEISVILSNPSWQYFVIAAIGNQYSVHLCSLIHRGTQDAPMPEIKDNTDPYICCFAYT